MRRAWIALGFAMFFALPAAVFAAPATVVLDDARPRVPVSLRADVLLDPSGTLTIDDVVGRSADFRSAQSLDLSGTYLHPRIYWLRFALIRGASNAQWALLIPSEPGRDIGRVDLYSPRAGGGLQHVSGGLDLPRDDSIVHRVLVLPSDAYGATNYARVVSASDPDSLELIPISTGVHDLLQRNTLSVFFMGYFVAIASLYLLLYATLRQRPLLQYAAIMASLVAVLYFHSTAAYAHLPAMTIAQRGFLEDALFNTYVTLLAVFATTFLRLIERDRLAFGLIVATVILNFLGLVDDAVSVPSWLDSAMGNLDPVLFFAALFFASVRAYRAGMRPALFFALAVFMVIAGYVVVAVAAANPALLAIAPGFLSYAFEGAIALEALLLGIAVTERIRETAREYERLLLSSREFEDMALRDALTGTLNRRAFDRGLADAWHTGASRLERLGLLMIDVDHFKLYNDRFGHQAGDECLRRVAQACASCVRGGDLFVRYGGEEFAAIVPNATMDDLYAIAGRMRDAVAALAIEHQTPSGRVTVSIGGAARYASELRSEQGLIELADAALYRAKEQGRDRAVLEGVPAF